MNFDNLETRLNSLVDFWDDTYNEDSSINLLAHQITRIYEVLRNGHRRILCGDATGAGKTMTAVGLKAGLDKKLGRETKALVFSPLQAIKSAWSQDDLHFYFDKLGIDQQATRTIESPKDLQGSLDEPFIFINYEKLGLTKEVSKNPYRRALLRRADEFDLVVFDECQQLKSLNSNRTQAVVELVERTKEKYSLLLSATPIPNKAEDVGFLLYLIDPEKYHHYSQRKFVYNEDKSAIKDMINDRRWLSFSRGDLKELFNLPQLEEQVVRVPMAEEYAHAYVEAWSSEMHARLGVRLSELRRILYRGKQDGFSALLADTLDDQKREIGQDQVLVFTHLRNDGGQKDALVNYIADAARQHLDSVEVITGDTDTNKRAKLAKQFQQGQLQGLVVTQKTMGEGIPLSTGDRPLSIIYYEPALTPGEFDQGIGRGYRLDSRARVRVYELIAESELASELMKAEIPRLEEEFEVKFKGDWQPQLLDLDRHLKREEKSGINNCMTRAYTLNEIQEILSNMDEDSGDSLGPVFGPVLETPKPDKRTPNQHLMEGARSMRDSIGRGIAHFGSNPKKSRMVDAYSMENEEYFRTGSAETNRIIQMVMEDNLLPRFANPEQAVILDAGSGTACLSRVMRREMYNVDDDSEMLEWGKLRAQELGLYESPGKLREYFIKANFKDVPLDDGSIDILSTSHALLYNAQGHNDKRDIEEILVEFNRLVKQDGFLAVGLTYPTTRQSDLEAFTNLLPQYGFENKFAELMKGHYHHPAMKGIEFRGFYLVIGQKTQEVQALVDGPAVSIYNPLVYVATGGKRRSSLYKEVGTTVEDFLKDNG